MDELAPLKARAPSKKLAKKAKYAFEIASDRSGQVLVVSSDQPLAGYQLDDPQRVIWPDGVRIPEGVLIGELDDRDYVVFVELKGTADPTKGKKGKVVDATEQLESMLNHFHPFERSDGLRGHGDDHHDRWTRGEDELEVTVNEDHAVIGLALYRRVGILPPPIVKSVGGREVVLIHAPFHNAQFGRLEVSFRELLKHLP